LSDRKISAIRHRLSPDLREQSARTGGSRRFCGHQLKKAFWIWHSRRERAVKCRKGQVHQSMIRKSGKRFSECSNKKWDHDPIQFNRIMIWSMIGKIGPPVFQKDMMLEP
jgi:hypothetical protein